MDGTPTAPPAPPVSSGKDIWLVAHVAPDADASSWKSVTDAMTAATGLLWPLIVLFALVFMRKQVLAAAKGLATRLSDPDQAVKLGPIELSKRVLALESQLETTKVENQVLANAAKLPIVSAVAKSPGAETEDRDAAWPELVALADQYKKVEVPNWAERVRVKDELAAKMASLVITRNIPRTNLAAAEDEGVRMALATVITTEPEAGDADLIKAAAPAITRKHVRYRFLMAIGRLAEAKLLTPADAREFQNLAIQYKVGADESLLRRIQRTLLALEPIAV